VCPCRSWSNGARSGVVSHLVGEVVLDGRPATIPPYHTETTAKKRRRENERAFTVVGAPGRVRLSAPADPALCGEKHRRRRRPPPRGNPPREAPILEVSPGRERPATISIPPCRGCLGNQRFVWGGRRGRSPQQKKNVLVTEPVDTLQIVSPSTGRAHHPGQTLLPEHSCCRKKSPWAPIQTSRATWRTPHST
jgi:hypothetical protein